ncbi:thioredoxin family protein [Tenacibaculum sp. UWU-22]|uniref:thioredoxin family protein n=1 Tax=Tenacibaculum sp. UWU-22 TaxID=3234187 RepID=UPI0034DB5847
MKKHIVLFAFILIAFSCSTQKNVVATAKKDNSGNLIGITDKASFTEKPYSLWFNKGYETYKPNASVIAELKPYLKGVKIKGFMGTWCGDSKRQVPVFYKILEDANFNEKNIELVAVDYAKKTPDNLQEGLNIIRVPTFIFYRHGKEIGRFVEHPRETVEKDFLKIVSGKLYKHSYEK